MVGLGNDRSSNISTMNDRNSRTRMKSRLQTKYISSGVPPLSSQQRRNVVLTELNKRITDLKMEGGVQTRAQNDPQTKLQPSAAQTRRDSNSTTSSFYGSMRSADMSRKSSLASQVNIIRKINSFRAIN